MQPSHVAGRVVGQALDSKSSVTELCLAYNELGIKGAMLAMRKAGSDVQGVNGQCGETNMACIFCVFTQTAKRPTSCAGSLGVQGIWLLHVIAKYCDSGVPNGHGVNGPY